MDVILMKNVRVVSCIISWFILILCPFAVYGATFTLSDEALLSLDYELQPFSSNSTILNITNVEGPGVQYDILYPDPTRIGSKWPELEWISCIHGGKGSLTGIDISSFDAFALKFTMVSASGVSSPSAVGPVFIGAMINTSEYTSVFRPELIAYNDSFTPATQTSVTTMDADQIDLVGFAGYIPWQWYDEGWVSPDPWDPDGAIIHLLVEQADDAVVITPEPATFLLLGAGIAFLRRK